MFMKQTHFGIIVSATRTKMSDSLKNVICENLARSLSDNKNIRESAEQQLKMLETNEEFGLFLMEIGMTESLDFPLRHLASVLLDQYVSKHWNSINDSSFVPPEVDPAIKRVIREYMLKALNVSPTDDNNNTHTAIRKLLNSYARTISRIAQFDWPREWPEMLPVLTSYIESGSPRSASSALKVFKEMSHEITDIHIPHFAPILLPNMLNVVESVARFSVRARANAIKVFVTIAETIIYMDDLDGSSINNHLQPHLERFANIAIELLALPVGESSLNLADFGLKKDMITGLTIFIKSCRKQMKPHLQKIMQIIWESLTSSAIIYVRELVNSSEDEDDGERFELANGAYDSDNESIGFDGFLYAMLEFVSAILGSSKCRDFIKPVLADLIYYILFYIQLTDEQLEDRAFTFQDLIEDSQYSIRLTARDLIVNLAKDMACTGRVAGLQSKRKDAQLFKHALLQAINRHFGDAKQAEKQAKRWWWKPIEACLLVIEQLEKWIIATIRLESQQAMPSEYEKLLETIISSMNLSEPYLAGRIILTASHFVVIMNDASLSNFFKLISTVFSLPEHKPVLRVFALRATYYFCVNVSCSQKTQLIQPYLAQFAQGAMSLAVQANEELLESIFDTIEKLLKLDKQFAMTTTSLVCSLGVSAFLQYPANPVLFATIQDVFEQLFALPECAPDLERYLLIVLLPILNGDMATVKASVMQTGFASKEVLAHIRSVQQLQPMALELLASWIGTAPYEPSETMITQAYPAVLRCLQAVSSDDSSILQNATDCIKHFVNRASARLASWIDPSTGVNGIAHAVTVCNNLLLPQVSESCSAFVGQLVCSLIIKAHHSIDQSTFQFLLRSCLVKLASARSCLITEGLVLVFAHLVYLELSNTLVFLNTIPAPEGTDSALAFVLDRWLLVQSGYYGYANKASTIALCRLFRFALRSNPHAPLDKCELGLNLHRIEVSQDDDGATISDSASIAARTRARTKAPDKKLMIPATVKMLKTLINELRHIQDCKNDCDDHEQEEDDEDEEDDDEEVDDFGLAKHFVNVIRTDGEDDDWAENDLEETVLSEEIASFQLEDVLSQTLKEFTMVPYLEDLGKYLTIDEKKRLEAIACG